MAKQVAGFVVSFLPMTSWEEDLSSALDTALNRQIENRKKPRRDRIETTTTIIFFDGKSGHTAARTGRSFRPEMAMALPLLQRHLHFS